MDYAVVDDDVSRVVIFFFSRGERKESPLTFRRFLFSNIISL